MTKKHSQALFAKKEIRRIWIESEELWYFSVVDIVRALTDSPDAKDYWYRLKTRISSEEKAEISTNCRQLKLVATDGKLYRTDCANTEGILRIIQSIPSPKAEPFKLWLARVGYERVEDVQDPELAINRALHSYKALGYDDNWINQRLKSIEIRKELTAEWEKAGIKQGLEYALLTDEISRAWAGLSTKEYKRHKGLKKQNLRDNMTNLELVLTMLSEAATTEISTAQNPTTFTHSKKIANQGGQAAKAARQKIEKQTGKSVVTGQNFLGPSKKSKKLK